MSTELAPTEVKLSGGITVIMGRVLATTVGPQTTGTLETQNGIIAWQINEVLPAAHGDELLGVGIWEGQVLSLIRRPLVTMPSTALHIRTLIRAASQCSPSIADSLYTELVQSAAASSELTDRIDDLAEAHILLRRPRGIQGEVARKFLAYWYRERLLRGLLLLGLEPHISDHGHVLTRLRALRNNAYWVPEVPLDVAERIYKLHHPAQDKTGQVQAALYRLAGALLRSLHADYVVPGHSVIPVKEIEARSDGRALLNLLLREGAITAFPSTAGDVIALPEQARVLRRLSHLLGQLYRAKPREIPELKFEQKLNPEQAHGVRIGLRYGLVAFTGPPGSGKSTMINELVRQVELSGAAVVCTSLMGKAVDRIRQVLGRDSSQTMHRYLRAGFDLPAGTKRVYLIVDEATTVRSGDLLRILEALRDRYEISLIMVGDPRQLQPIGWGHVFTQILQLPDLARVDLVQQFRFGDDLKSGLHINARALRLAQPGSRFVFQPAANFIINPRATVDSLLQLVVKMGIVAHDFRILTPYNKDVTSLNTLAQAYFLGGVPGTDFQVGDPVMYTENDSELGLANGNEGVVTAVSTPAISVDFGQEEDVIIPRQGRLPIIQCYALTGNRSQGSEYPYVAVWIPHSPVNRGFLDSAWACVATSRARRMCWLLGAITDLEAAATRPPPVRADRLADLILAQEEGKKAV